MKHINILQKSKNIAAIKEKLSKQYNFTKSQLATVLEKYKNNTEKLKTKINKLEQSYNDACKYTSINISALLFDALVWETEIL